MFLAKKRRKDEEEDEEEEEKEATKFKTAAAKTNKLTTSVFQYIESFFHSTLKDNRTPTRQLT